MLGKIYVTRIVWDYYVIIIYFRLVCVRPSLLLGGWWRRACTVAELDPPLARPPGNMLAFINHCLG